MYKRAVPWVSAAAVLSSWLAAAGLPAPAAVAGIVRAWVPKVWVLNGDSVSPVYAVRHVADRAIKLRCDQPSSLAITPNGRTLYVGCTDTVIPIDAATGRAARAIHIGPGVDQIVITPNGRTAYVGANNTVVPIRISTNRAGKPIKVARRGDGPLELGITPNGKTVYSVNSVTVVPIATRTNKAGKPIYTGPNFLSMVITPDGKTAYVLGAGNSVVPINTATNRAGKPIVIDSGTTDVFAMAIAPDGKTIYVPNFSAGTVVPVSTVTKTASKPIKVGPNPDSVVVTPNGKTVYVVTGNAIYPINTATNRAGKPVKVGFEPGWVVVTPNGKTAWVSGDIWTGSGFNRVGQGYVLPINTATNRPGKRIKVGKNSACLIMKPWRSGNAYGPSSCPP